MSGCGGGGRLEGFTGSAVIGSALADALGGLGRFGRLGSARLLRAVRVCGRPILVGQPGAGGP